MMLTDNLFCKLRQDGGCFCDKGCSMPFDLIQRWYDRKGKLVSDQTHGMKVRRINMFSDDPREIGVKISLAVAVKHYFQLPDMVSAYRELINLNHDQKSEWRVMMRNEGYPVMSALEEQNNHTTHDSEWKEVPHYPAIINKQTQVSFNNTNYGTKLDNPPPTVEELVIEGCCTVVDEDVVDGVGPVLAGHAVDKQPAEKPAKKAA